MHSPSIFKSYAIIFCALTTSSVYCHANPKHSEIATSRRKSPQNERILAEQVCNICAFPGSSIRGDFIPLEAPSYQAIAKISHNAEINEPSFGKKWTCGDWHDFATKISDDSTECIELRDLLARQCCDGKPPLYECETMLENLLFTNDYKHDIVPVTEGDMLDVNVVIHVSDVSILDYGYDGGALEVSGSVQLHWMDDRLKWNSSESGCSSITVDETDKIWMPTLFPDEDHSPAHHVYTVGIKTLADGHTFFTKEFRMRAGCKTVASHASKLCSLYFHGFHDSKVNYVTNDGIDGKGLIFYDIHALPEYELNLEWSNITDHSSNTLGGLIHDVVVNFEFVPLNNDCNICGDIGAELYDGIVNDLDEDWLRLFPSTEGLSCADLYSLLTPYHISSEECSVGRANFEEACCDDHRSLYECEKNIHDDFVGRHNTVTPPDPHVKEGHQSLISKDLIDVGVSLDIMHVVGIDVKSNSLKMLVGLELDWFDPRLVWEPFIGGCHRVSYRASLSAEETEIWVPNIELVNLLEGVQTLPEAFASVWYDGHVRWRRTGILEGVCDLSGIIDFPYDTLSCSLEFGGTRDPYFHRVSYHLERIEYAKRVSDDQWNFQQYKLLVDRTENMTKSEVLSGFENNLISTVFYFDRAHNFYVHMFVLLYIIFTYLSFGSFLIDYKLGERLGYGASILFVLVAQDITMSEATPVTQEFLWIYKVSLGSKVFVIFCLLQSVAVLWIFSYIDWKDEVIVRGLNATGSSEEMKDLMEKDDMNRLSVIQEHNQRSSEALCRESGQDEYHDTRSSLLVSTIEKNESHRSKVMETGGFTKLDDVNSHSTVHVDKERAFEKEQNDVGRETAWNGGDNHLETAKSGGKSSTNTENKFRKSNSAKIQDTNELGDMNRKPKRQEQRHISFLDEFADERVVIEKEKQLPPRQKSFRAAMKKHGSTIHMSFRVPRPPIQRSEKEKWIKKLKIFDIACAVLCILLYSIFLTVLFSTVGSNR